MCILYNYPYSVKYMYWTVYSSIIAQTENYLN